MPGSNRDRAEDLCDRISSRPVTIWALAVSHALLFIAAFPPVDLWPLILLAPIPLVFVALNARSTRLALLVTLATQTGMWLWMSRWLFQITEAGLIPYAIAMASWSVLFVWVLRRFMDHRQLGRLPMTLALPAIWVGIEFLRGELLFDGYPWFLLAHPLVELPVLVQSADVLGTYFISFLAAMVAGAIVDVLRVCLRLRLHPSPRSAWPMVGACLVLMAGNVAYGWWRMSQSDVLTNGPSLLIIQTNLPQDNKMRSSPDEHWQHFQQFVAQTHAAHSAAVEAGEAIDLIVWPETMVQGWGFEPGTLEFFIDYGYWQGYRFAMATEVTAGDLGVPMLVGSPAVINPTLRPDHRLDWEGNFNSAYLVKPLTDDAELGRRHHQRYDKIFLTPFGETMPYIRAWPWLQERMLAVAARGMEFNLQPGDQPDVLVFDWDGGRITLATPICFEATMSRVCRALAYDGGTKRADVMVNLSNDGWFGSHHAGRMQHAQISRFRAIENRTPLVRAANTGMSVSIDSNGRVVERIGDGRYGVSEEPGSLVARVQLDARHSVYGRIGDLWGWGCLLMMMAVVGLTFWKRQEP